MDQDVGCLRKQARWQGRLFMSQRAEYRLQPVGLEGQCLSMDESRHSHGPTGRVQVLEPPKDGLPHETAPAQQHHVKC